MTAAWSDTGVLAHGEVALLERAPEMALLRAAWSDAGEGRGSTVLVSGEAGIGKSSLIHAFLAEVATRTRVLVGACDDLSTPRTLGAVRDAFAGRSQRLDRIIADGTRDSLLVGVLAELADTSQPTDPRRSAGRSAASSTARPARSAAAGAPGVNDTASPPAATVRSGRCAQDGALRPTRPGPAHASV